VHVSGQFHLRLCGQESKSIDTHYTPHSQHTNTHTHTHTHTHTYIHTHTHTLWTRTYAHYSHKCVIWPWHKILYCDTNTGKSTYTQYAKHTHSAEKPEEMHELWRWVLNKIILSECLFLVAICLMTRRLFLQSHQRSIALTPTEHWHASVKWLKY